IAAIEADVALASVTRELRQAEDFNTMRASQPPVDPTLAQNRVIVSKTRHYGLLAEVGPPLQAVLTQWRDTARSRPGENPVDRSRLAAHFAVRQGARERMVDDYGARRDLAGNAEAVWREIMAMSSAATVRERLCALAPAFRSFVEARVTDWRRHRLYGVEPEFPNNTEDLSGHDCLISIGGDALLGTETEHHYGLSVWCPTGGLRGGRFDRARLVYHSAV
ncbi:MAG TPA: hypothetical protein VI168_17075, partial [Croceibacterium sp.]